LLTCLAAAAGLALASHDGFADDITLLSALLPDITTDPLYKVSPELAKSHYRFLNLSQPNNASTAKLGDSLPSEFLNLRWDSEIRETTRIDGLSFLGFFFGNNSRCQENSVGYMNFKASVGDSVRMITRMGASNYDASEDLFVALTEKKAEEQKRLERFAHVGSAAGTAMLTRLEEDVFASDATKVTLFQEFARVDPFFEDIKFSDKAFRRQTKDDVFSKPDRETNRYGLSLVQGSAGVTFSQSFISNLSEGAGAFYRENRLDSKAWLGLRDATEEFWGPAPWLGSIVPTNIWVSYSDGAVTRNGPEMPVGTSTGWSAGASWKWGEVYADLSGWRSFESTPQQVRNPSFHSVSDGADFSIGVFNKYWKLSAYASLTRTSYEDVWTSYTELSVDGGVSVSFMPEHWPGVTLALDASRYSMDHVGKDGVEISQTLRAGFALDFSNYLFDRPQQKLQLVYYAKNEASASQWGVPENYNQRLDHLFGAVLRGSWQ
jgi:hypothetical protein